MLCDHVKLFKKISEHLPDSSTLEVRDAFRLALQSSLSGGFCFIAMQAIGMPEKFLGVLSACLVVQANIGSTLLDAKSRLVSTLIGCAIATGCLSVIPYGYGTAAAIAIPVFVIALVAEFKAEWRYGIVGAVALALGAESEIIQVSQDRILAILVGGTVGICVSLVAFPEKAKTRAEKHLRNALSAVADYLANAMSVSQKESKADAEKARERFSAHIASARKARSAMKLNKSENLNDKIEWVDRLSNSVLILKRVGERDSNVAGDNEDLDRLIEEVNEGAVGLAKNLSEGKVELKDCRSSFQSNLDELRKEVANQNEGEEEENEQRAVAFALGEVDQAIGNLLELYGGNTD